MENKYYRCQVKKGPEREYTKASITICREKWDDKENEIYMQRRIVGEIKVFLADITFTVTTMVLRSALEYSSDRFSGMSNIVTFSTFILSSIVQEALKSNFTNERIQS